MWERVKQEGFIVFVLPGSPMGFRFQNDLRDLFIAKSRSEANIVAPCPHHKKCPLAKETKEWCRFEQNWLRLPKSVFPKLEKELNMLKTRFTYLVVRKGEIKSKDHPLISK